MCHDHVCLPRGCNCGLHTPSGHCPTMRPVAADSAAVNVTAQLRSHLDKWLNYLLIEYKQNTIGEKGEVFNTAHSSREIKCSFMSDFFF